VYEVQALFSGRGFYVQIAGTTSSGHEFHAQSEKLTDLDELHILINETLRVPVYIQGLIGRKCDPMCDLHRIFVHFLATDLFSSRNVGLLRCDK
jgi:hypothetical protein